MIAIIVKKLAIDNGHFHIEYRISGSGMFAILEVAFETNYLEQMMKFYLGKNFNLPKIKNNCYTYYFLSNKQGTLKKLLVERKY